MQIEGVRNGGTSYGVFVNAIRLVASPTGTKVTLAERVNGNLRITVVTDYPGQPVFIHQTSDLSSGNWTDTGISPVEISGVVSIFEIPLGDGNMFFRPVSYPSW